MRCTVSLKRDGSGVVATCAEFPGCEGRGSARDEALARLRESVLFWLETCPCDVTAGPGLILDVTRDETGR